MENQLEQKKFTKFTRFDRFEDWLKTIPLSDQEMRYKAKNDAIDNQPISAEEKSAAREKLDTLSGPRMRRRAEVLSVRA
jgi:hypothetical protein